ncbi:plasmid maintenance protein [Borrelia hispanica]
MNANSKGKFLYKLEKEIQVINNYYRHLGISMKNEI